MARDTQLRKACRGLSVDTRAVKRVIQILDTEFWYTQADAPHLTPDARKRLRLAKQPPALPAGELSLVFLDDAALARLHGTFLDDPSTTDVITFEGDAMLGVAGEICVSVDTALAFATEHGRDFSEELTLYLVHGWLHLAGYDDLRPEKKRRMRAAEKRALDLVKEANALPVFRYSPKG